MSRSLIFLLALSFLLTAGCKSSRLPKSSARIQEDSIKLLSQAEIINELRARRIPGDTLTFYIKQITQVDCPELLTENQKLHKRQKFWKKVAGVLFVIATGHYVSTFFN